MDLNERVLVKIKLYVAELFTRRDCKLLKFHNFHHTESVVQRAYEISSHSRISETELFCLIAAAWFHDTGHLFNELKEHEKAGTDLMAAFLKTFLIEEKVIEEISACIMATKMPSNPGTDIEKIICDADTYHFGTKEFIETDPRVFEEMEARLSVQITDKAKKTLQLLESHQFYTAYCRDLLTKGKLANIEFMKRSLP